MLNLLIMFFWTRDIVPANLLFPDYVFKNKEVLKQLIDFSGKGYSSYKIVFIVSENKMCFGKHTQSTLKYVVIDYQYRV